MTGNKTVPQSTDVAAFLDTIDPQQREDARTLCRLLGDVTGQPPVMWGATMVGFGSYHYTYASGREGDTFVTGFAPRKKQFTLYIMDGFERHAAQLDQLGPHKLGKACLYIRSLRDIDLDVLRAIVAASLTRVGKPAEEAGR